MNEMISPERQNLIRKMQEYYESRTGEKVTDEESDEMLRNLTEFFTLLMEWDAREKFNNSD